MFPKFGASESSSAIQIVVLLFETGKKEKTHVLGGRKEFYLEHIKLKVSMGHWRLLDIKI